MSRRYLHGYTLLELLFVLAMSTMLLMLGIQKHVKTQALSQIQRVSYELGAIIQFSKLNAISHHQSLLLLPEHAWSNGMRLVEKSNPSHVLHQWHWDISTLKLSWHGFTSDQSLLFSDNLGHSAMNGTFKIKMSDIEYQLIVNRLGRVMISPINSSAIPNQLRIMKLIGYILK